MKSTYTLHKLPEGFIVTSEEIELNENCYEDDVLGLFAYNSTHNMFGIITQADEKRVTIGDSIHTTQTGDTIYDILNINGFKVYKIIAQQDQIDFSALSEEKQKEIGWYDVDSFASEAVICNGGLITTENEQEVAFSYYYQGFQKAQELLSHKVDKSLLNDALMLGYLYAVKNTDKNGTKLLEGEVKEKLIQSLSQPKSWDIECVKENGKIKITKIL
jgi:hypothetical protein